MRDPAIYLMDEPLGSLDAKLRAELRIELKRIHAELGATLLYVTHDQTEAMTMASQVGALDGGRLAQFGTPRQIYEDPVSEEMAARLGQPQISPLAAGLFGEPPARAARIGLRPEHVAMGAGRPAQVARVERLGDQTRLYPRLDGHDIVTLTDPHTPLRAGETLALGPREPLWFDAAGARIR